MGPAILKRLVCTVDAGGVDLEDGSSVDSPCAQLAEIISCGDQIRGMYRYLSFALIV